MTIGSQIAWDDTILPFQLDRSDIRGRVARLDGVLDEVLAQHDYPPAIEALVAEMALLTALIGQTVKLRWRLSIQVRGDGPVRLIATDWFAPEAEGAPARMRAYAGYDPERFDPEAPVFPQLGKGYFAMIVNNGEGQPYQGLTPLAGGSLAASAEAYFAQSEQIATRFSLAAAEQIGAEGGSAWRAGGLMLQHMPPASPLMAGAPDGRTGGSGEDGLLAARDVAEMAGSGEAWNRVNMLLDTVETHELVGPLVAPDRLLLRLFHEETPRVWPPQKVDFGCTCSPDKVRRALHQYSAKDLGHMTTEDGKVTADCQFCGSHFEFDPDKLGFEAEE